jgi:hypothetical protein
MKTTSAFKQGIAALLVVVTSVCIGLVLVKVVAFLVPLGTA